MSQTVRNQLLFYLALPAVIGFLLGANRTGIGTYLPWWLSVFFWVTCTLASWAVFHVGTVVASRLTAPWEPPLIAKLALGLLLASLPARLLINAYVGLFEAQMLGGRLAQPIPDARLTLEFAVQYAQTWSGPYVLWISANFFFDRVVGFSRYRAKPRHADTPPHGRDARTVQRPGEAAEEAPAAPTPAPAEARGDPQAVSALLSRLPRSLGLHIVAVKSEDHYLRVYTDRGDALVLYKLSTAMEELAMLGYPGLQVHRSFWVRRDAVVRCEMRGRTLMLRLSTGLEVPVSQTYRETVRKEGLLGAT